ncbi:TonB-dependent receptor plug domain-containing protein [Thermomonas sp.]|uniref:TonB-dependent receptor plug domain-containing protein n=1 Tax=Thermomonas sp. TaxID=1971895 RepID=UPI003784EDBE
MQAHTNNNPYQRLQCSVLSVALLISLSCFASAHAEDTDKTGKPFELGRVVVQGQKATRSAAGESAISREQLDTLNRETVGEAVAIAPGVSLSHNSRNEAMVYVRGFDPRQVPVFLDGIPQYVPYDGYIDFDRFTTFGLGEIHVAKGAASLLYGPNTLGGAINLVSRKPTQPLEGDVRLGAGSRGERKAAANLGMRRGDWYLQAGWSWLDADSFPLPDGFKDYKAKPTDTGDERENAYRSDRRASIKLGYAPGERSEFAIGYVKQDGEKGNPVYTGRASGGIRYWRWPWWDKESLYFIGNIGLGESSGLKLRAYEDHYGNGLEAYADGTYATQLLNTSFPSVYSDKTRGVSVELSTQAIANHDLHLALHYKDDRHQDTNPKSPTKDYRDVTTSLALEDTITLGGDYTLRLGASHEQRDAKEVYYWPTGTTRANNALIELQRDFGEHGQLFASVSHKTRFPTIKDRYSARMGAALPNPDLKPETAHHIELGWRGQPWAGAQVEASLFQSRIDDLIQDAIVPSNQCGGTVCNQARNIGKARNRGVELSLQQRFAERGEVGAAYTWMDRDNLGNPAVLLTNSPRQRLFAHAQWAFSPQWKALATAEAEQGRIVTYAGPGNQGGYLQLHGYASFGAKLVWSPLNGLDIEAGGRNLGDKWYELAEGYPMPGRTWFANISYRF